MTVVAFTPDQPNVEVVDGRLVTHAMSFDGSIVELIEELGITTDPDAISLLLRQVVETGATVIGHGHRRAAIDAIAAEIERLMQSTAEETGKLPEEIQVRLGEHLTKLAAVLDARFDGSRTSSVQHQIKELVKGSTSEQVRALLRELLGEGGPLAASNDRIHDQLKLVVGASTDVLAKVTSLVDKLEQKQRLAEELERSAHKGRPFEELVEVELIAIHGRLGDQVRCVKDETGLIPGSEAGDHLVTVNTSQTGGRDAKIAVEAKTGKLSGPKAQAALKEAMENRGAHAGVLVFDGVDDAPLGGRRYMAYPDGRICVVLDEDGAFAFEVACIQARLFALAAVSATGRIDASWLNGQCDKLAQVIEKAVAIKHGSAAARRGLDKVDTAYTELRTDALDLLEEIKTKLAA